MVVLATLFTIVVVLTRGFRPQPIIPFGFLLAILASAWWGGYGPGLLTSILCYSAVPYLLIPNFQIANIDATRLTLTILVSLLVSRIAAARRESEQNLLTANKLLEQKVAERTADLLHERDRYHALASHLLRVQETERRHLSREIHDSLGQELSSIKFQLQRVSKQSGEENATLLRETMSGVDHLVVKLREIAANLRPPILDHLSLSDSLQWLVDVSRDRTGLDCAAEIEEALPLVSDDIKLAIFRICQEALTNAIRHGNATRIALNLRQKDGDIVLSVKDDGCGFDTSHTSTHLGLLGMTERADSIGADLKIDSAPGLGTKITLVWRASDTLRKSAMSG